LKHHFTKPNYDVFKYNWKTRASVESFNKRKDRYFFERLSRKKSEQEIKEFYISNFAYSENPNGVYISDLMKDGFKVELEVFLSHQDLNKFLECKNNQHSLLIKKYLQKALSLETIVIVNEVLNYTKIYDKLLTDPIWEMLSLKIKKYSPFLEINKEKYIQIMKENICE
jgi:hypothetical protein